MDLENQKQNRIEVDALLQMCSKPVAFHPALSRTLGGNIGAAIFLQQIIFWSDKGFREDGWIYKSDKEIGTETTLSPRSCNRIRKQLKSLGILSVRVMRTPSGVPTNHYRVNKEVLLKCIFASHDLAESTITENTTKIAAFSSAEENAASSNKTHKENTNHAHEVISYFKKKCWKEIGIKCSTGKKDYVIVRNALGKHGLSLEECKDLIDEWFVLGRPDDETVHITRAFSLAQINSYRVRNR